MVRDTVLAADGAESLERHIFPGAPLGGKFPSANHTGLGVTISGCKSSADWLGRELHADGPR